MGSFSLGYRSNDCKHFLRLPIAVYTVQYLGQPPPPPCNSGKMNRLFLHCYRCYRVRGGPKQYPNSFGPYVGLLDSVQDFRYPKELKEIMELSVPALKNGQFRWFLVTNASPKIPSREGPIRVDFFRENLSRFIAFSGVTAYVFASFQSSKPPRFASPSHIWNQSRPMPWSNNGGDPWWQCGQGSLKYLCLGESNNTKCMVIMRFLAYLCHDLLNSLLEGSSNYPYRGNQAIHMYDGLELFPIILHCWGW